MDIKDNMIPFVCDGIKVRKEDFGLLIVSKRTPILTMNEDSTLIWNSIDGNSSISQISQKLNKEIDGDESNNKTIMIFIENCYKLGLLDFKS